VAIDRVDPADPVTFEAWFDVLQRSSLAQRGQRGDGWVPDEWRARAVDESSPSLWHLLAFRHRGVTVAALAVEFTRDDNVTLARANVHVDPDCRRRGHGTNAVRQLEQYVVDNGRQTLTVSAMEGPEEVDSGPSREFAPLLGYVVAEESVRRDIDWPRPERERDELRGRWEPLASGYDVTSWRGTAPESFVAPLAQLHSLMRVEADFSGLEVEPEMWDIARVRRHELETDEMGRELLVSVAIHSSSGMLAGFSELTVSRSQPATAYQWNTLVLRAHRGHRLGGLMKLANFDRLEWLGLPVTRISTFNAKENTPMIRVNENLGAHVAGSSVLWSKDLEG
jgi:GNAT superfamily N-acetyltransferase